MCPRTHRAVAVLGLRPCRGTRGLQGGSGWGRLVFNRELQAAPHALDTLHGLELY